MSSSLCVVSLLSTLALCVLCVVCVGISVHGKEYVEKNEKIVLTCNATGGTQIPEDVDWFKDGTKIDTRVRNHVVITKFRVQEQQALVSTLIIDHARLRDSGTYICRSSDKEIDSIKVTVLVGESACLPWKTCLQRPQGNTDRRGFFSSIDSTFFLNKCYD